ncbi:putative transcriptional regulatory protein [Diplodia seriata]|uniref:Putative transcriptional regulatory protein n=1 Tax=Diplodia seriata TaxID=420778 RepID=A0A1S8BC75_9PEZI|nr:putative transcriptional regulatory protein [Diplodia seriata]
MSSGMDDGANTGLEPAAEVTSIVESFGTLEIGKRGTRYTTNGTLAKFHGEVRPMLPYHLCSALRDFPCQAEELRTVLAEDGEAHADDASRTDASSSVFESIWGQGIPGADLLVYLPPATQMHFYLDKYAQRVDPHIKILHMPTESAAFSAYANACTRTREAPKALIFAMCFSAVTSLSPEECERELGEDQRTLLLKYRLACQCALNKDGLPRTRNVSVLQAFVLLLCSMPGNASEEVWLLSGLAVRIAQQMGLHRDGSHFSLSPFDVEMRRRLWWQICYFDLMVSERCGLECTTMDSAFDTHLPLNVPDQDLSPCTEDPPEPRCEYTEMSCSLIRFELVLLLRRMRQIPRTEGIAQMERCITHYSDHVTNLYLHPRNSQHPLCPVGTSVFHFSMSKLWLLLYRPFRQLRNGVELPQEIVDKLFVSCLECLESWDFIATNPRVAQRSVLFRSPRQWHQLCYVLLQLINGRDDELAQRAWRVAMETSLPPVESLLASKTASLLRPLHKLMAQARETRNSGPTTNGGKANGHGPGQFVERGSDVHTAAVAAGQQESSSMPEFVIGNSGAPWAEWQSILDEMDMGITWDGFSPQFAF